MDIEQTRNAAGAAYARAAEAYITAYLELHSLDQVAVSPEVPLDVIPGFGGQPVVLSHREFLPDVAPLLANLSDKAAARSDDHRRRLLGG